MAYQMTEEERRNLLADLLNTGGQEQVDVARMSAAVPQAMPQNYIQRGNNAPIDLGPSQGMQSNALAQALDYSAPPVMMGGQKGYRVKGDPFTVMMHDGTKLSLGNDMAAGRKRDLESLNVAEARQKLSSGELETKIKKAQLDELMGIDPAAGTVPGQAPKGTPTIFPTQQQGDSSASPARQKLLSRRFGSAPANYRWDEQGNAVPIPGVEPNLTETQGNALTFSLKAKNALDQKAQALDENGQPYNLGYGERMLAAAPYGLGQGFIEGPAQRFVNAEKNFIAAVLRKESGAAISQGEYDQYGPAFFDRPGDSPELLRDKAIARQTALETMKAQTGNQYDRLSKRAMGNVAAAVPPAAPGGAPVTITSDADYASLSSGSMFVGPDGKTRRKP